MAKSTKSTERPPTAASIRAAIDTLDPAPLEAARDALVAKRRQALLGEPDEVVAKLGVEVERASLAVERATVQREELVGQLAEAEAAEAEAGFRARYADIIEQRDALLASYSSDFAKAARAIAGIAQAEAASEASIADLSDDALERYHLTRPVSAAVLAWGSHFLASGVSLANVSLPPTKSSPPLGALARAPQALQPRLGA